MSCNILLYPTKSTQFQCKCLDFFNLHCVLPWRISAPSTCNRNKCVNCKCGGTHLATSGIDVWDPAVYEQLAPFTSTSASFSSFAVQDVGQHIVKHQIGCTVFCTWVSCLKVHSFQKLQLEHFATKATFWISLVSTFPIDQPNNETSILHERGT